MSITIDGSTNTITSSAAAITVPAFTTLSSTGNATLGDSSTLDTHTLNGKSTVNDIRFAAVSASLPSLSFVDACFHLAKDDTDKGAWRKKKGQSWRSEARSAGKYLGSYATATAAVTAGGALTDVYYNTTNSRFEEITNVGTPASTVTYRAGREDYPTNALITAEASRIIIWDLDTAVPSMWMVFVISGTTTYFVLGKSTTVLSSVCVKDGLLLASSNLAVVAINISADSAWFISTVARYADVWPLSYRNTGTHYYTIVGAGIVNATVNDVAITILPDAPIDEYGMPVPTIAVATGGGVSVINNNGTVADLVDVAGDDTNEVVFDRNNNCYFTNETQGDLDMFLASNYDADDTTPDANYDNATIPALLAAITATKQGLVATKDSIVAGHSTGLSVLLPSTANKANGMISYITSAYNTGYMVGDVRRCFLSNSKTVDRSVKAATLTEVGTVTETTYTGGRSVYSGFSAANYFQEASHADWNALGTGDFSIIMSGVTWGTAGVGRKMIATGDLTAAGHFSLQISAGNQLVAYVHDGTTIRIFCAGSTSTYTDTSEHVVEFKRLGTSTYILVDGVVVSTTTGGYATTSISNATAAFIVGTDSAAANPWTGGQVACVRISATAPTTEQSKFIAAAENALNGGNACLLSNSSTVSALSYDKDTDTYLAGNGTNVDTFKDLKRIASQAHGVTTLTALSAAAGRNLIAGTGATYTAPERNVSAELLEAQVIVPKEQQYLFTTPAATTTQALPQGWKARGIAFNTTDGTFLGTYTQTFDGFIWTLGGLTASKAYQINLVEA